MLVQWTAEPSMKRGAKTLFVGLTGVSLLVLLSPIHAEVYVAAYAGASFPADLRNVEGTGTIQGVKFNDLDLANALTYGGKVGYFSEDKAFRWLGAEAEIFTTNPHVKQQQVTAPGGGPLVTTLGNGAHVRAITGALNMIVRYPHPVIQPYAGVGLAFVNAKVSDETFSISDAAPGLNLLAGLKGFLTKDLAVFAEVKYTYASFQFEDRGLVGPGIKGVYSVPAVVGGIAWHFK